MFFFSTFINNKKKNCKYKTWFQGLLLIWECLLKKKKNLVIVPVMG